MKPVFQTDKVVSSNVTDVIDISSANAVAPAKSLNAVAVKPPRFNEDQIAERGERNTRGLSTISSQIMDKVRASDTGDFGADLNKLVVLAKGMDPAALGKTGIWSRMTGAVTVAKEKFVANYATVERQLTTLKLEMEAKALHHKKRITDMNALYNENVAYHQGLEADVQALKADLEVMKADYAAQQEIAVADSFDAQLLADHQRCIAAAEKRVDDLTRAMLLAKMTAPQIRLMQDNARGLVQGFSDIVVVGLPAWMNNVSLYILQLEQKQSVELKDKVDSATDEALRRTADLLRQNTQQIAQSRQRAVIGVDTLQHVHSQLMGSVTDVLRIEAEGKALRDAEAPKIKEMEQALISTFAPKK